MLAAGADKQQVWSGRKHGSSALYGAACQNRLEAIKILVEVGDCNVNIQNDQATALSIACEHGFAEVNKYLISKGADVNLTNAGGKSPIFQAATRGQLECIQPLAGAGAKVNQQDGKGTSPLLLATQLGNKSVIQLLLSLGADANLADHLGATPSSWPRTRATLVHSTRCWPPAEAPP